MVSSLTPKISIIIPSLDDSRKQHLDALLKDLEHQTFQDFEIQIVRGDRRQGRAINRGARDAAGELLVIMDDDTRLADEYVLERLVACLEADPSVGLAGASILMPPWANRLQIRAMGELPRRYFPTVEEVVESDMAQHPCCALRKDVFWEVGGEREDIVRGLDPYLRQVLRDHGYRIVIAPRCGVYHLLPDTFAGLMRMAFRNGKGSAFAQRIHPELVFETGDGLDESFAKQRPFGMRMLRYPWRFIHALSRGQLILASWLIVYALGVLAGYLWLWRSMQEEMPNESASRNQ